MVNGNSTKRKILLGGYTLSLTSFFTIAQYKKDGVPDSSFGQNGVVHKTFSMYGSNYGKSIAVQQNGKIIVAGYSYPDTEKLELMRFTPHGVLDSSFGTNGIVFSDLQSKYDIDYPAPVATLQEDGKIVVAGNGQTKFAVVRYNDDPVAESSLQRQYAFKAKPYKYFICLCFAESCKKYFEHSTPFFINKNNFY
jgi:uncharacterized delta-60 repeat protein